MASALRRRCQFLIAAALCCAFVAACAPTPNAASSAPAAKSASPGNDYSAADTWLCRPGRNDACSVDESTTIVNADGTMSREDFVANPSAPIDCFYVYPTISRDPGGNSDMQPGREEMRVVMLQFARFASQCRVYAPLYRQVTMTALRAYMSGNPINADRKLAYDDIADAWKYYLEHDNQGRGFVLIGHSQGANILTQLVHEQIDGRPIQGRLVSVILAGTNLKVPSGKDVGGDFAHIPLCRTSTDIHCAIAFASFRAASPPPDNGMFGFVADKDFLAACVNPASLAGGSANLHSYFASSGTGNSAAPHPFQWLKVDKDSDKKMDTPFVSTPGLVSAECVTNAHGTYLEISTHANDSDARVGDVSGDLVVDGKVQAIWGLHAVDMNLVMGDLLDVVAKQAQTYSAGTH